MSTIQSKKSKNELFFEAVDYLFRQRKVTSQQALAEKIGITASAFSRIKSGLNKVSDETLVKMNNAFGGIFNMPYFRGDSNLLLSDDAAKASGQVVQESAPIDVNPRQSLSDTELYHKTLDLNAQIISDLRKDLEFFKSLVLDKDATIQDNAEQIISLQSRLSAATKELEHTKNTLAAVRKNFDAKVAEVDRLKVELEKQRDPLARYPFTPGVADGDNDRNLIATDE